MRYAALLVLASALVIAACGPSTPTSSPSGGNGMVDATGDWRLVEGMDGNVPIPIVEGYDITMSVEGSEVSGRSACNWYGAEVVVVDGRVQFGPMSMTEMACGEPVMVSESAYLAALARVQVASRDGDRLMLDGDGVELVFEALPPLPTADIVGTTWLLDSIITGDAVSNAMGEPATLLLSENGTLTGGTGCRTFTGRWTLANGEIMTPEFSMDQSVCDPALTGQDNHVVGVLGGWFRATVDGRRLTLTSLGDKGLGYRAAEE